MDVSVLEIELSKNSCSVVCLGWTALDERIDNLDGELPEASGE